MNLLNNKELLRGLLRQGDLINTINGGVSMTRVVKKQYDDEFLVSLSAPGLSAEAFNVVLNDNQLIVFSVLPDSGIEQEDQLFNIPLFYRSFDLPKYIDIDKIEAYHDDRELRVVLPFKENAANMRKIDIKHLESK
jgi:HSP20 family protein